jgi:hypothetical protein
MSSSGAWMLDSGLKEKLLLAPKVRAAARTPNELKPTCYAPADKARTNLADWTEESLVGR